MYKRFFAFLIIVACSSLLLPMKVTDKGETNKGSLEKLGSRAGQYEEIQKQQQELIGKKDGLDGKDLLDLKEIKTDIDDLVKLLGEFNNEMNKLKESITECAQEDKEELKQDRKTSAAAASRSVKKRCLVQ